MKKECYVCRRVFNDEHFVHKCGSINDSQNMFCPECLENGYDINYKEWQKKFDCNKMNQKVEASDLLISGIKRSKVDEKDQTRTVKKEEKEKKSPKQEKVEKNDKKKLVKKMIRDYSWYKIKDQNFDEDEITEYVINNLGEKNLNLCAEHPGTRTVVNDLVNNFVMSKIAGVPIEYARRSRIPAKDRTRLV